MVSLLGGRDHSPRAGQRAGGSSGPAEDSTGRVKLYPCDQAFNFSNLEGVGQTTPAGVRLAFGKDRVMHSEEPLDLPLGALGSSPSAASDDMSDSGQVACAPHRERMLITFLPSHQIASWK